MTSNEYLEQVMRQQAQVEDELKLRARPAALAAPIPGTSPPGREGFLGQSAGPAGGNGVEYRITGWLWKTVVVPPNVYVVHTRKGASEPVHMGLGVSFGFDPYTDSFLLIPAAVQTLLINARCISAERQGVLVQAYVQWVVEDLKTAYRRLDFSDTSDPMRIVNVQLREQAEAAIKDTVAAMPIDKILSDKQPIIEELTSRLRSVAEGGSGRDGLGLKIVTVQIKEAVVSSTRLWENLQKPFRADREKQARLAEIEAGQQVTAQEREAKKQREAGEIEVRRQLDELRSRQEQEAFNREQAEKARRMQSEEELAVRRHELEAARSAREMESLRRQIELERAQAELEQLRLDRQAREHSAQAAREALDVEVFHKRRVAENDVSEGSLRAQLISRLPEIASALPKPEELRQVTVSGEGSNALAGLVAQLLGVLENVTHRNGRE
jgi:hypothetical protein